MRVATKRIACYSLYMAKKKETNSEVLTTRVTAKLLTKIRAYALENDLSEAQVVRLALREMFAGVVE